MAANATATRPAKVPVSKQPPENSVWIRYHPWIEGGLSFISSNALHALVFGAAVLWSTYLMYAFGFAQTPHLLPVEPVRLVVPTGDGQPVGATGDGRDTAPFKEGADPDKNEAGEQVGPTGPNDLPQLSVSPKEVTPAFPNPDDRLVNPIGEGMRHFDILDKKLRGMHKQMGEGSSSSNGKGGTGTIAGTGPGPGTGGDPSNDSSDKRHKRMMRWSMRFDTRNSGDYLRQLEALGAVLAIPDGPNSYKVVELTKKPFRPEIQDVSTNKKIWWFDNNPDSVRGLMKAMDLPFRPQRVVAFIPQEVEEELAKKELETGLKEDDIFETTFGVRAPGMVGRKYDVWVIDQKTIKEMKR